MTRIGFSVTGARVEPFAAVPTLLFDCSIEAGAEPVESLALRCQIRIEPGRRRYEREEQLDLGELFGEPERWGDTTRPFLWTHVSTIVPGFTRQTSLPLPVPCSYDLEVAAAKYFHGLEGGEVPLLFLFSGSMFVRGAGGLRIEQVPWDREASFRMPVATWRALMDAYFPEAGWLRLNRDTLRRLGRVKGKRALATWDEVMGQLLRAAGEGES